MFTVTIEKRNRYTNKLYRRKTEQVGSLEGLFSKVNRISNNVKKEFPSENKISVNIFDFVEGKSSFFDLNIRKDETVITSKIEIFPRAKCFEEKIMNSINFSN